MFKRNQVKRSLRVLLDREQGWYRLEATVIAAKTAADMADAEAVLLAECALAGRSVELMGMSDAENIRIYKVGETA